MSRRMQRLLTAWLAAGALVLKAAVPLLAAAAAQLQGVPVAQVCSLYGVATSHSLEAAHHHGHAHHHSPAPAPAPAADGDGGGSHSAADHGRDHCALTAVVTMAVGHAALPSPLLNGRSASTPDLGGDIALRDAYAMWIAPLAHGPPLRA